MSILKSEPLVWDLVTGAVGFNVQEARLDGKNRETKSEKADDLTMKD